MATKRATKKQDRIKTRPKRPRHARRVSQRQPSAGSHSTGQVPGRDGLLDVRVGQGYDVHPLGIGRKLILGGIEIPHAKGLLGHSDADALVHAVCDALLGAMGEGDLGRHFPSSNPAYRDISSLMLLKHVCGLLDGRGYRVLNIDSTIIAQAPRLGGYLSDMAKRVAETIGIDPSLVNVKVKSGEGLDAVGREEGIATQAVCLIAPKPSR
ncbi:MAG: 2-C-methyl-D-erythritol 2,4-cyclodiphosphate synthase [Nitrospiraceae bacterium]